MYKYLLPHNKKRFAAVCLLLILLLCCYGCDAAPALEEPEITEDAADPSAGYRKTVLYYATDDGLMVPVMKYIPWEEGIGVAALNQLVSTEANRLSASMLGLNTVVPEGVSFHLSISDDAVATLNMFDLPAMQDSEAEANMLLAVVNTLTEFPTIDRVRVLFDGKEKRALPHGTKTSAVMAAMPLNEEPVAVSASAKEQHKLTLYFPNSSASLHIPVSRTIDTEPTLSAAMEELINGPADPSLLACFPAGTALRSANIDDSTACVDLSAAFLDDAHTQGLQEAALTSMMLTAKQFDDVTDFRLTVEGVDYVPEGEASFAMPVFANSFR